MILDAMTSKTSPWAKPTESEFAPYFRDAAQYRAEYDRENWMRELAEHLGAECELPPVSETVDARNAIYVKKYIAWCEEIGIRAIIADPFFFAQYLRELATEGFSDLRGVREAVTRAHWFMGHGDGTAHPSVDEILAKYEAETLPTQEKDELKMYDDKKKQGIIKNGEKLPTRKELDVDPPSKTGFWMEDQAMASGQQDIPGDNPNFSNPHGGKSKGQ